MTEQNTVLQIYTIFKHWNVVVPEYIGEIVAGIALGYRFY